MTSRAEELITQLEAEIAERDARIAELEAQAGEGTSSNKYRAELYDEVWQAARDMGYGNVTGALQDLAALKAQQPSAGVPILPPQCTDKLHHVKYRAGWNCCLSEVARLNPCRAQAVPDGWRMVKVGAEGVQFGNAWFSHEGITGYTAEQLNSGNCRVTGRAYMDWFAAAPSTKKESE